MMKIEPSILPSLAWFALIVRAGSFSRAASEMGITRAALSQNLKSLEERLKEGANKRGNSSRLTQSFHFFMFEPIFSPVNALNQPI